MQGEQLIIGLILLVVVITPLAMAFLVGWVVGRRGDSPTIDGNDDLSATARTIRRLANEGSIDPSLRRRLLELVGASSRPWSEVGSETAAASSVEASDSAPKQASRDDDVVALEPVVPAETLGEERDTDLDAGEHALAPDEEIVLAELVETVPPAAPVHPLDAPEPVLPPASTLPQQRRRALADVLQAFMAEKNIRWGELVSGILIVGCSIALVISLRREIESLSQQFIYLPALLFMLATAAIHGAGNYTLRRWKLRATSRGVLIIATLLIPINFLAAIIVTGPESKQLPLFHPLYISAVVIGLISFGTMAYFAGQALLRDGAWRLWIGVIGTSCGQLIISRAADNEMTAFAANALVATPLTAYLVSTVWQLQKTTRRTRIGLGLAVETLLVLGVVTFALVAPIGLLLSRADSVRTALAWLSTPLSLPAVVILGTGLSLHRRLRSRRLSPLKTTGTTLAVLGGAMMFASLLLAWPDPELMVAVGLFSFLSLTLLAAIGRLPVLHVPACATAAFTGLVALHLFQGSFAGDESTLAQRILELLLMGRSCVALTVFAVIAVVVGGTLIRLGKAASGFSYLVSGGGVAVVSILLSIIVGFSGSPGQEVDLVSPVLLFYSVALIAASFVAPRAELNWAGTSLLLCGLVHAFGWNAGFRTVLTGVGVFPNEPILVAVLAHGIVASALSVGAMLWRSKLSDSTPVDSHFRGGLILPLIFAAMASSVVSLIPAAYVEEHQFIRRAMYVATLATIWLASTVVLRSWISLAIFQSLATISIGLVTASVCEGQAWWSGNLLAPQHLYAQFAVMAIWCLAWSVGRRLARMRWPSLIAMTRQGGATVDEFVLACAVIGMLATCLWVCRIGVAVELGMAPLATEFPFQDWRAAFGSGAWIAALALLIAPIGSLIERFTLTAFSALFVSAAAAALLIVGPAYEWVAVASGIRWSFAALGVSLTIAALCGGQIASALRRLTWLEWKDLPSGIDRFARFWTVGLIAAPVLGLTTVSLVQAALSVAPNGPSADCLFGRMGSELSFGTPLALLVSVLVAFAVRERNARLMLSGSGVFQYLVNLAYFLPILCDSNSQFDWSVAIGCLQWNALGLAVYSLAWLAARRWIDAEDDRDNIASALASENGELDKCIVVQIATTVIAVALTAGVATFAVIASPHDLSRFSSCGEWLSYLVCLLGFGAAAWLTRDRWERFGVWLSLGCMMALAGPLAITLEGAAGGWRGFHVLMMAWSAAAISATALAWLAPRWWASRQIVTTSIGWATWVGGLTILLASEAALFDPATPWWSFGISLAMACVMGALGFLTRSQAYAYASTLATAAAASMAWWGAWPNNGAQGVLELVQLNLIAFVASSLVWMGAELWSQLRGRVGFDCSDRVPAVHRVMARVASSVLLMFGLIGFILTGLLDVSRSDLNIANESGWILLLLLGGLLVGSLWDRRMHHALLFLYVAGIAAMMMTLDMVDRRFVFDEATMFVTASVAFAAYVAMTGHIWRFGANLAVVGERFGMHDAVDRLQRTSLWLPAISLTIAAIVSTVELVVVLAFPERWMRVAASLAPLLLAYGVGCQAQLNRRDRFQRIALSLASLSVAYAALSDIQPNWASGLALERSVRLLMVLAVLAFLYVIPLARLANRLASDWSSAVKQMGLGCGVGAIANLVVVLLLELAYFRPGVGAPFGHPYQVVAVAVVLVGLIVTFLVIALAQESDSLTLTEASRMGFVYAAQITGALLFAHLYLSHPQMFGMFEPYWPYIVLGIAFAGVGVGELFQRSGRRVLAEPFQRTGGFLPLLPALGWWLNSSLGIAAAGHYSLVLFLAGLLFAMLSMLRKSYISGIAAAVAGNAALWAILGDYQMFDVLKHPQFWLIPPAVSALVAVHINRRAFTESQLTAARYIYLLVIYVSSTADVFLEGIGNSLWEPMVLATLSVIGVFVGIGLQIRAFLYLGATFVFLSVLSMVWHAYANVHHVGIWWGFGIALGLLILTVFGVFEKKRPELMRVVNDMRQWDH